MDFVFEDWAVALVAALTIAYIVSSFHSIWDKEKVTRAVITDVLIDIENCHGRLTNLGAEVAQQHRQTTERIDNEHESLRNLVELLYEACMCGPGLNTRICKAINGGDMEFLEKLRSGHFGGKVIPLPANACVIAVQNDNLPMLKWLRSEGMEIGPGEIDSALSKGNPEIIDWILDNVTDDERAKMVTRTIPFYPSVINDITMLKRLLEPPLFQVTLTQVANLDVTVSDECFNYLIQNVKSGMINDICRIVTKRRVSEELFRSMLLKADPSSMVSGDYFRMMASTDFGEDYAMKFIPSFKQRLDPNAPRVPITAALTKQKKDKVLAWLQRENF